VCDRPAPAAPAACTDADLAEVVRRHGHAFVDTHRVCASGWRALDAIAACRTPALGGHVEVCDRCGASRAVYHSCRNRHCPKCQKLASARWLEARMTELLPIEYFHVVFTLPHEINTFAQADPRRVYSLLFHAAAQTLLCFGADPKHLGALVGVTAILHTWGQNLSQHVHLHCIVTGGGLSPDANRWIHARKGYLFPVRALSRVFRGKYLDGLRRCVRRGELPEDLRPLIRDLERKDWLVYAKPAFAGPEQVLRYLGRYTHRIAISNERIIAVDDRTVTFHWRDYRDDNRTKVMTLDAGEFLRRFLLHVLPSGFTRIRHFGLFANRGRRDRLSLCRSLLELPPPDTQEPSTTTRALIERLTGIDISRCPVCQEGTMRLDQRLPPASGRLPSAALHHPP
jgi:hypothetical protein